MTCEMKRESERQETDRRRLEDKDAQTSRQGNCQIVRQASLRDRNRQRDGRTDWNNENWREERETEIQRQKKRERDRQTDRQRQKERGQTSGDKTRKRKDKQIEVEGRQTNRERLETGMESEGGEREREREGGERERQLGRQTYKGRETERVRGRQTVRGGERERQLGRQTYKGRQTERGRGRGGRSKLPRNELISDGTAGSPLVSENSAHGGMSLWNRTSTPSTHSTVWPLLTFIAVGC